MKLPQNSTGQDLGLSGQRFGNRFFAVNANWRVVLLVDNALHGISSVLLLLDSAEWTGRIVVTAANVLHLWLLVGQRCLGDVGHMSVGRVARSWARNGTGRCDTWAPGAATTFHCELEGVARPDDQILCVFVSQIECVHIVHPNNGIADLDARLVCQTAGVDLGNR